MEEFQEILEKMEKIRELSNQIKKEMDSLKMMYQKTIQQYSLNVFVFCLDSFFFKYKIMEYERDQFSKTWVLINNRMYGDYYKLYNVILMKRFKETGFKEAKRDHPNYRDLEPFREYTLAELRAIHQDIIDADPGSSFTNYLSFFHQQQKESLWNLGNKIAAFHSEIQREILSDEMETYLQKCAHLEKGPPMEPNFKKPKTKTFIFSRHGSPQNSVKSSQPGSRRGSPNGSRHGSPAGSRRGGGKHEENSEFSYKDMIQDSKSNRLFISNPLR